MRYRTVLFLLVICLLVATIDCNFNPFMDSEYFSIDWAGHESSKPGDVCIYYYEVCDRQSYNRFNLARLDIQSRFRQLQARVCITNCGFFCCVVCSDHID